MLDFIVLGQVPGSSIELDFSIVLQIAITFIYFLVCVKVVSRVLRSDKKRKTVSGKTFTAA